VLGLLPGCALVPGEGGILGDLANRSPQEEIPPEEVAALAAAAEDSAQAASEAADVYYETGERFYRLDDLRNASTSYRKALQLDPSHYAAQFKLAETLSRLDDNKTESVKLLKGLLHRLHYANSTSEIEKIRSSAEELLLGLDELGMALSQASNLIADYGVRAERARRYESALKLYQHALTLWPACSEARKRAYQLCRKQGWEFPSELVEAVVRETYLRLDEVPPTSAKIENGRLLFNATKWGLPIYNKGTVFKYGLWAPAPSRLVFKLDGRYKRFSATVLVSAFKGDEQQIAALEKELSKPGVGTVRFGVAGDGRTLHESGLVTYGTGPREIDVDVTGVKELILEAHNADGSDLLDFAVWANGRLYMR
jgi:tetratricopeptide (TPR) repeat protein